MMDLMVFAFMHDHNETPGYKYFISSAGNVEAGLVIMICGAT